MFDRPTESAIVIAPQQYQNFIGWYVITVDELMNDFCHAVGLGDIARKREQRHLARWRTLGTVQRRTIRGPFKIARNNVRGPLDDSTPAALCYRERICSRAG